MPLIRKLNASRNFNLHIIAFGSHPYREYGKTIEYIRKDGIKVNHFLKSLVLGDDSQAITDSMGLTILKISDIYNKEKYDLLLALGDRFEMFSAVAASVPFNIPVAHLHGGETTLGAIDEKFRHANTIISKYHFVSTKNHAKKVKQLTGYSKHIYNVGALALDNMRNIKLMTIKEIYDTYNINVKNDTLLATIHPETVKIESNKLIVKEFIKAIKDSGMQTVITLPNNDTGNAYIRKRLLKFSEENERVFAFDALGTKGYYSFMKYCYAVVGNSSSGIVEAASYRKYVINIGDRQKGRDRGRNVIDVPINSDKICKAILRVIKLPMLNKKNIFGDGNTAEKIIKVIEKIID